MAIYNNGIIIHFLDNNRYGVELVTTVPIELCISTQGTLFKQNKNFINYSYEKFVFYSNPTNFFESIGYKIVIINSFSKINSKTKIYNIFDLIPLE